MPAVYTPGLRVSPHTGLRYRRSLPIPGRVCVQVGQRVQATDTVAETQMPGDVLPLNLANMLGVSPSDVPRCMLVKQGDAVTTGQLLARSETLFGLLVKDAHAPAAGTIETVSAVTGQVILRGPARPLRVAAYTSGVVAEVLPGEGAIVEGEGTLVQGIFGIGPEAYGPLWPVCKSAGETLDAERLDASCRGAIVVGAGRVTAAALAAGVERQVAAIVTGGIDDADLRDFLGYDLGVAVTGSEKVGLTLIITEGFGDIAMAERTFRLLVSRAGQAAACNGATQIRAGVIRPEVIVPRAVAAGPAQTGSETSSGGVLELGAPIRVIRDPYFGLLGTVAGLPPEPQWLASGAKARVAEVKLADGRSILVPRANLELVEE
jgi:biotin carboxyl carrier protein